LVAPLPNLDLNVVSAAYSSNSSCVANLKLVALMVAEISREPNFFDAPLTQTPPVLAIKVCSW